MVRTVHTVTLTKEYGPSAHISMRQSEEEGYYILRNGCKEHFDHRSDAAQEFYAQVGEAVIVDDYKVNLKEPVY